jgi:hypothetical protein
MAKKKAEKVEEKLEIVTDIVSPKGSMTVYSQDQRQVRTYSSTEHGPKYKELAWQFAKKIGGVAL